jgi:flagellar hook-associated protein 1 FlgK
LLHVQHAQHRHFRLNAAQVALATVSNNIANASTSGYSEESVDAGRNHRRQSNSQYTIGSGVDVVAVQRAYSQYLTTALWSSNSNLQARPRPAI